MHNKVKKVTRVVCIVGMSAFKNVVKRSVRLVLTFT